MSPLSDIAVYLEAQGYGIYANANPALNTIFLDEFQDQPDNQIVIFGNGGRRPEGFSSGSIIEWPSVDIQIRNTSKTTARSTCEAIRRLLEDNTGINGVDWTLNQLSYPVFLGKDNSNRYRFAISLDVAIVR